MKIAFLGNMNNNHFSTVRYLRKQGIDAELLLYDNEITHFHPSCDTYDNDYKNFCRRLGWGSLRSFYMTSNRQIRDDLDGYDLVAGCGYAPAFLNRAGLDLDIFVPYGDDIWAATFYKTFLMPPYLAPFAITVPFQRRGIRRCRVIHMNTTNDMYETQIHRYASNANRWHECLLMLQADDYDPEKLPDLLDKSPHGEKFRALRAANDLILFYHGRHSWTKGPTDPNSKGMDRLFKGWAELLNLRPGITAKLVTFEYGSDSDASKELIGELGIQGSVEWLPMMQRKELMVGLLMADIVCGEFEHSWMSSGILFEALVGAKPILTYRDEELYRESYPDLYAIMNAREPIEIAQRLAEYLDDPDKFKAMGQAGRRWYLERIVEPAIDKYVGYITRHHKNNHGSALIASP